ncbi:MAG: choline dehydrogenase [Alphaproteobacteria bacterium HGW-Alphaproteobacteria-5]|nr:MAG: choline dehydrogenase [Alphaproteobacteria bacterium HGW-Alphaproteobacteria-5]
MNVLGGQSVGYDYVVIGAGSSGAVVAARLAENQSVSVLLIEAGPVDKSLYIRMPAGLATLFRRRIFNWNYFTERQSALGGRRIWTPRGKVLGGSSSINGMAYIRGHALDYERWAEEGAEGWSYAEVLPYFKKLEAHADRHDGYHGRDGAVGVTTGKCENPLFSSFIEAGLQAGYSYSSDFNGQQQEGFGRYDMNVDKGVRASSALAYLRKSKENLHIQTGVLVDRIMFDGRRATGVSCIRGREKLLVHAQCEVILCAGAINSPKLLLASGIGPAEELKALDIETLVDAPDVGRNLQDHLEFFIDYRCKKPITAYGDMRLWNQARIGAEWLFKKTGKAVSNYCESGAFIRSDAGVPHPDIQFHFYPGAFNDLEDTAPSLHGYRVHVGTLRSQSRGTVKLKSLDPTVDPVIDPNYMSRDEDWKEMRACVRLGREIMEQDALKDFRGEVIRPTPEIRSDSEIDAFLRATATTAFHPSCTCRMGNDASAVVDPQCRVRGVEGLRVADTSIMPSIVSGNLNAPAMMIGEKAADMIAGRQPLPPESRTYRLPEHWTEAQR